MASVIFLNGASSAGKTTIGTAVQDAADTPYLLMGLDTCFGMVPAQWAGGPMGKHRADGFQYLELPDEDGRPMCGIGYGPAGFKMLQGLHRAVREFVLVGNSVIVDEMSLGPEVSDDWLVALDGLEVLTVGVYCDVDELERREAARRGPNGLARWSSQRVHDGMAYDLTVDTTGGDTEAVARKILAAVGSGVRRS